MLRFPSSQKFIASQTSSARVIIYYIFSSTCNFGASGARVSLRNVWGRKGQDLGGTDAIDLQLVEESNCQQSNSDDRAVDTTIEARVTLLIDTKSLLQVTPYHGDKANFLVWKWSFLIAVRAISKPLTIYGTTEGMYVIRGPLVGHGRKIG